MRRRTLFRTTLASVLVAALAPQVGAQDVDANGLYEHEDIGAMDVLMADDMVSHN